MTSSAPPHRPHFQEGPIHRDQRLAAQRLSLEAQFNSVYVTFISIKLLFFSKVLSYKVQRE